ncbi:MAG: secondary thiamine-phosphate synthase enzyme YjbQ [Caldisericaceae bacterium]
MIYKVEIKTKAKEELIDITDIVEDKVRESNIVDGLCVVFVPHTTACVFINENTDPNVKKDILNELGKLIPDKDNYLHLEGNSQAHIKSAIIGSNITIFVSLNQLMLGSWQGIFFGEFDGPRSRYFYVKIMPG